MNQELAMARCKLADLELQAKRVSMACDSTRGDIRQLTASYVAHEDTDVDKLAFAAAEYIASITLLRATKAEMTRLKLEYNL